MPGVEEPLVIFLDEIAVGGIADFELEPQLLEFVFFVLGKESLIVAEVQPSPLLLERRIGAALEPGLARAGRPVGHDRRPGAQNVDARSPSSPRYRSTRSSSP